MASSAGRRNILRELNELGNGTPSNILSSNTIFPPTPTSPEEQVIQIRGRKKTIQPNIDDVTVSVPRTPTKNLRRSPMIRTRLGTPTKFPLMPTRSSPRKRLNLTLESDYDEVDGMTNMSLYESRPKRAKLQFSTESDFSKHLLALSQPQLVQLVKSAAEASPEMKEMLKALIPSPDLSLIEKRLYNLQRNIFKAYPRNVYGSQDDTFCFNRVRTHIEAFKRECLEQGRVIMESEHWATVFEYILLAWKLSKGLPQWACPTHNKIKEQCIRQITILCLAAVKKAKLNSVALKEIEERIRDLDLGYSVDSCLIVIAHHQKKAL